MYYKLALHTMESFIKYSEKVGNNFYYAKVQVVILVLKSIKAFLLKNLDICLVTQVKRNL